MKISKVTDYAALIKSAYQKKKFSYFSFKIYVVGTQKNCLNESLFQHPKHM